MQYFCNSDPRRARSHFTKCGICRTSCSTALRDQRDRPPSQTIHRELNFYFSSGDTMTAAARNAELVRRIERSKRCSTAPLQCPRMRQTRADCLVKIDGGLRWRNGRTKMGRLWAHVCDVRPGGSEKLAAVWFAYTPDRRGEHPPQHLAHLADVLSADSCAGGPELYPDSRVRDAARMAHARRKIQVLICSDPDHLYRTSRARPARSLNFVRRARVSPACPTKTAERP